LKGSALKVAQMLSMEKSLLPKAYVERFSLAQFSVPPLSAPLVRKTFKSYFGKYPEEIFDTFASQSVNAASIGQVHKAEKDGKKLAVKIQYPGVADSISSDLAMVKPIAVRMFNLQGQETDKYFKEIEGKLLEETDYIHEIKQSVEITEACSKIPNLKFPKYYKQYSRGQALWDFYMYQMHVLKAVHADPHPGNFLIDDNRNLIAIDFGCIKEVPLEFYTPYFELAKIENINNPEIFRKKMFELEILLEDDTPKESKFFSELFHEMLSLFTSPFHGEDFDFSDETFWNRITELSEKYSNDKELRKMNGSRGSRHFLYINRTFFGLYNLLHDLKAHIKINNYKQYQ